MKKSEKAIAWAKKQIARFRGLPFEGKPRNYYLAASYLADALSGDLADGDINPNGSPSKLWRAARKAIV